MELVCIHYKKKTDVLVMEIILELNHQVSDQDILNLLLQEGVIDLVLHQQIPKKKRL